MHQGVLVGLGTIEEVFRDPWHPYVKGLAAALQPAAVEVSVQTDIAPAGTPAPANEQANTDDETDAAVGF
jgi:ABC-type dipeptide/oligopeptide/nickel transport system ATPase component